MLINYFYVKFCRYVDNNQEFIYSLLTLKRQYSSIVSADIHISTGPTTITTNYIYI